MRKLMMIAILILFTGMAGYSQVFAKKQQAFNVGIGVGNTGYWGSYYSGFIPSVSASYEYGIVEVPMGSDLTGVISAGGYLGWSASKYSWNGSGNDHYLITDFLIAARGNYHFRFHDQFDPYAGIILGVLIEGQKWVGDGVDPDENVASTTPFGGAYAGARWYFTDNFAVFAEVGWQISVLTAGVTFKID
jgi:hypothetical protein